MKQKNKISYASILLFAFLICSIYTVAQQPWVTNLNTPAFPGFRHDLGTTNSFPIDIYTNNVRRATFTTGNTLGVGGNIGDGLRIWSPTYPNFANLDLWTDAGTSGGTHIKWDGSGLIQGSNNRFEVIGNLFLS